MGRTFSEYQVGAFKRTVPDLTNKYAYFNNKRVFVNDYTIDGWAHVDLLGEKLTIHYPGLSIHGLRGKTIVPATALRLDPDQTLHNTVVTESNP